MIRVNIQNYLKICLCVYNMQNQHQKKHWKRKTFNDEDYPWYIQCIFIKYLCIVFHTI